MFDFFKRLIPRLGGLFARAARTIIGQAANRLEHIAEQLVREAQSHPDLKTGKDKFDWVKGQIKERFPSYKEAAINLAIELAVAVVKDAYISAKKELF